MSPGGEGHELFYEYHSNESLDPAKVLFHALGAWRIKPGFHDILWHPAFVVAASQLLGGAVRFWHDQLFCKPAHHGGVVAWHQDYSYWTRTQPLAHLTCWIGLDDASLSKTPDAGALFAGAIGALGSVLVIHRTGLSPFVPPILFFPLLADALLTLAYRVAAGHKVLEGHSEHIYQIGLRAGWSHSKVAVAYWMAMAACGIIAFVVTEMGGAAPPLALALLAVASLLVAVWARRYVRKTGI